MKKLKRLSVCMVLSLTLCLCMGVTAFASGGDETQEPITEPIFTEETETPAAFTPDGNGQLVDSADEEDSKLFYTIKTANGNYFYMVIDEARDTDNVYMMNLVSEDDLLAFIEEAEGTTGLGSTAGNGVSLKDEVTENPELETEATDKPVVEEPATKEKSSNMVLYVLIFLIGAGAIGGFYYFKILKPKQDGSSLDDDLEFYDDEDYVNEDEAQEPEYEQDDDAKNEDGE